MSSGWPGTDGATPTSWPPRALHAWSCRPRHLPSSRVAVEKFVSPGLCPTWQTTCPWATRPRIHYERWRVTYPSSSDARSTLFVLIAPSWRWSPRCSPSSCCGKYSPGSTSRWRTALRPLERGRIPLQSGPRLQRTATPNAPRPTPGHGTAIGGGRRVLTRRKRHDWST